ncbi:N-acetylglucosamine-6-phosphate deacetylase [Candidatus Mycoplasma mahonii]|uniref:N-acetylglucosamine-6-phosphate deacetylase n=1 Tax=Candidatus Mycoplasma mahonii TaxID=3004105 RepID=UPI0026EDB0DC|nr:N-acetylglucosamine-6-phosphate deacetylase [Candidatus Mycoplasma mahonii]WKX02555.1 N-acetylglucosamine-6-phosphate deacetylase [Candidatus Mycoplasma mahonii]
MQLKNVKIINHNLIISNANIEIKDNKIVSIERIKGNGVKIIVPGFIDTHIHGFMGNDAMDSREAVEQLSIDLGNHGTTSFFPVVMTESLENIHQSLKNISDAKFNGSKILGIHLEGPYISHEKKGAHDPQYIIKPKYGDITKLQKKANGLIKKITFAPEVTPNNVVREMVSLGISPSIGHTNASYDHVINAINLGANSCTHLWNAMSGVQNRKPGVVEAILNTDTVYAELITDLVHVDKEAIKLSIKSKGPNKIVIVTDSIRPSGLPDGNSKSGGLEITKSGDKITLKGSNTIAGSAATMYSNFSKLILLGYDIQDIVAMTSYNAAKNMNLIGVGKIKEGYFADIIMMDKNFNIKEVYINGNKQ